MKASGAGWLMLDCDVIVHVVPGFPDLSVGNDHILAAYCWCHPVNTAGPLERPILSHNDETWAGSDRNRKRLPA